MARTREYLGAAQVAAELGVDRSTITKSLQRHGPKSARPFPAPRVRVGNAPGWAAEQLDSIREWFGQPAQGRPRTPDGQRIALREYAQDRGQEIVEDQPERLPAIELGPVWRTRLAEQATTDPHGAAVAAMCDIANAYGVENEALFAAIPGHIQDLRDAADKRDWAAVFKAAWAAQEAAEKRLGDPQE